MLTALSPLRSSTFVDGNPFPSASHSLMGSQGFSAMEMMVTVAIVAVLAGLAAPSFQTITERWRVRQATDTLVQTLYMARSEAIKRGGQVGIQKAANNTEGCTTAKTNQEWGCGWFVFHDLNDNGKWNNSEPIIQTFNAPPQIQIIHQGGGTNIKVDRFGKMSGMNAKGFILSPLPNGISSPATRGVCMSTGGRVRIIEDVPCS